MESLGVPWDQGQGFPAVNGKPVESDRAFNAFRFWLEQGETRTFASAAARFRLTASRICQVSKQFNWKGRAEAYDTRSLAAQAQAVLARRSPETLAPETPADNVAAVITAATNNTEHLSNLLALRSTGQQLGALQMDIASSLLTMLQKHLRRLDDGEEKVMRTDFDRLLKAATMAAASGHKMTSEALGVEELTMLIEEALNEKDARLAAAHAAVAVSEPEAIAVECSDAG